MRGVWAFVRKELVETIRTWRIFVLPGIVLFAAVSGPPLAKYALEIMRTVLPADQAGPILDAMPRPTYMDAYLQWTKNLTQVVLIAAIIIFGGVISSEKRSGTAALVLTKPLSRSAFVVAKAISSVVLVTVPVVAGAVVTWGMTSMMFGEAPAAPLARATGVWLLFTLTLVMAMELLSATIDSQAGAAGVGLGLYGLVGLASMWGPALTYSPVGLLAALNDLARGATPRLGWPMGTAMFLAVALVLATVAVFRRREL